MNTSAGEIIERTIRRSNRSISELAKEMKVSRGSFYYWFSKTKIDQAVVLKIGELIGHDFSADFPNLNNHNIAKKVVSIPVANEDEVIREVNYWKTKYKELSEKYNEQMQKKDQLHDKNISTTR